MSDLIYRQDAIDALGEEPEVWYSDDDIGNGMRTQWGCDREAIEALPSAERNGKWIDRSEGGRIKYPWYESYECNQCGHEGCGAWEYCPRCGARMVSEDD